MKDMIQNLLGALLYTGFESTASHSACLTTVPSNFDKSLMVNMKLISEENIIVMPNCLDYTYFNPKSNSHIKSHNNTEEKIILYSGALSPLKGIIILT